MQCNIDARGKRVRLITGALTIVLAVALGVCVAVGVLVSPAWWLAAGALLLLGGFGVFEARAGWCAVRAMGWKTPV